jgi:hypothetical protein
VAIDDATRLAYVEVLPDEKQATTVSGDIENWARGDTKTGPPCSQQQPCD